MTPIILIPARLGSTRLPGKVLPDIAGLPMIVHVLRRAIDAPFASKLLHTVPRVGYRLAATTDDGEHEDD